MVARRGYTYSFMIEVGYDMVQISILMSVAEISYRGKRVVKVA